MGHAACRKCIRGERDPWEDIGVDERIVSNGSQMRLEGSDWRLAQVRDIVAVVITGINLVFRAGEGMCRLAEELLASQEGLCCMELLVKL